jgi:dihydrofolate reductase
MKKIIAGLSITLDGVVEGPGPTDDFEMAGWTWPYFSEEIGNAIGEEIMQCDTMMLGRKTYDVFEASFASQTGGIADVMNSLSKVLVSTTGQPTWANTRLISSNVMDEIRDLKQQDGKGIIISGSISLVQSLLRENLVDTLVMMVYPVTLGVGMRLFAEGMPKNEFQLVSASPVNSNVVKLKYQPKGAQ